MGVMDRCLWRGVFSLSASAVMQCVCEKGPWLPLCPALGSVGRVRSPHTRVVQFMESLLHVFT